MVYGRLDLGRGRAVRKVERTGVPVPEILVGDRARSARREVGEVLLLDEEGRAQRRPPFDNRLISDPYVKGALAELFANKCAYCETPIGQTESIDVDHFRPRVNASGPSTEFHHYSWLAYDWDNLLPSCPACNRNKGNRFPVRKRRAPLFATVEECRTVEGALLIDPCFDDPAAHLDFLWNGVCSGRSPAGKASVDVLGLNRRPLMGARKDRAAEFLSFVEARSHSEPVLESSPLLAVEAPYVGALFTLARRLAADIQGLDKPPRRLEAADFYDIVLQAPKERVATAIDNAKHEMASELTTRPDGAAVKDYDGVLARSAGSDWTPRLRVQGRRLETVELTNFKGIERLELHLDEKSEGLAGGAGCLMLLGENATGKSSVLEAIALALVGVDAAAGSTVVPQRLLRRKGVNQLRLLDPDAVDVRLRFYGVEDAVQLHIDPLKVQIEGEAEPAAMVLAYGPRRYFVPGRKARKRGPFARIQSLFSPETAIPDPASWLQGLAPERFNIVARGLREILALRSDDQLLNDPIYGVCVRTNQRLVPLDRMSEGYRSAFAMAVDIMREALSQAPNLEAASGVVLIDEIETHLHPRWKMRIMAALRRALPGITFIATTHDPLCLRGMENGEVVVLYVDDEGNISPLEDLPNVKGMSAEQLLTSDYFGLASTADPEADESLLHYLHAVGSSPIDGRDDGGVAEAGRQLSALMVLGDTPAEQILQEAIRRFIAERRDLPPAERTQRREALVQSVVAALRQPLEREV